MEVTKLILPETDPDVVRRRSNEFLKQYRLGDEYQKMKSFKDKKELILEMTPHLIGQSIIAGFMFLLLASIEGVSSVLITITKCITAGYALVFLVAVIYMMVREYAFGKVVEEFEWDFHEKARAYNLGSPWEDEVDDFFNMGCLFDIELVRRYAAMAGEGITYKIKPASADSYVDFTLGVYKDGKLVCEDELYGLRNSDTQTYMEVVSEPGVYDFRYLDEDFWAGDIPYMG